MKITVGILGKDRVERTIKVDMDRVFFRYKRGLYYLPPEHVCLTNNPGHAVLYYLEGESLPLGFNEDISKVLDLVIIRNFLLSTANPRGISFALVLDGLKTILSNPIWIFSIAGGLLAFYLVFTIILAGV